MIIGLVIDDSLDRTDGVQQYVLTLGQWLSEQGHQVHYICGETRRRDLQHLHSLAKNITLKFNQNRLSIPRLAPRSLVTKLLQENFDVLHVQMPYSPALSGRIIKAASPQTAIVGTFHVLPANRTSAWAVHLYRRLMPASLARFDALMSVSQPAHDFMKRSLHLPSQIVPNPVNFYKARTDTRKHQKNTILFLGRLVERKGAAYLLKAFAGLPDRADYRLIIAGKGPLTAKLRRLAQQLGINAQTDFLGFIPEADKYKLLASAQLAVFPSTGGESFGISLIEAMAAGTAVLAGDNPGYAAVLRSSPKSLIQPTATADFTQTLHQVLTDNKIYSSLWKEQQKIVQQFDIEKVGPQVLAIYESALQHRSKVR
jgi:phosphatidylinositol alpha-mannosyltransferase